MHYPCRSQTLKPDQLLTQRRLSQILCGALSSAPYSTGYLTDSHKLSSQKLSLRTVRDPIPRLILQEGHGHVLDSFSNLLLFHSFCRSAEQRLGVVPTVARSEQALPPHRLMHWLCGILS